MSRALDQSNLEQAFKERPDIVGAIQAAATAPAWAELFNEISSYVVNLRRELEPSASDPATKKRKLEDGLPIQPKKEASDTQPLAKIANGFDHANDEALLQVKEISMVVPLRKKFTIEFTENHIQARDPKTDELVPGTTYPWKDISHAFCLTVPEKAQKQYNYILFLKDAHIVTPRHAQYGPNPPDPLVLTIPSTAPKPGSISGKSLSAASAVSDQHKTLFDFFINQQLKANGRNISIVEANWKVFSSAGKETYKPNDPAVHVKAFRGSKDGYLYFLPGGILWGFKKPLIFLPKEQITAVSYVNVLQRTFNLVIEVDVRYKKSDGTYEEENEEFEFGMLDQEDFAGIDAYVKRHGLQDASMADQRKAKRLGINTVKGEDGSKVDVGDSGELQRAELELGDEVPEEEDEGTEGEDYDPGTEGESEGSGLSSDEDSDAEGGGGGEGDEDDEDDDDEGDEEL
ncbi:hypothetical protein V502_11210 [Pseudogymnoascus sp. VKM F-4520 (FW-2644)]|nr:hypothetical protein V502_11210 [Pseudogymnoascus sp. VKM F-4520 (FW-2644)]